MNIKQKTIINAPKWKKTFVSMEQGDFLEAHFKDENYLRHLATKLKAQGYLFKVSRTETGISVTCMLTPRQAVS